MSKIHLWKNRSYLTREGTIVKILHKEKNTTLSVNGKIIVYTGDNGRRYYENGRFSSDEESPFDLIEDVTSKVHKGVYINNQPWVSLTLPDGPLYFVWNPDGETPVRYLFTKLALAEKIAARMANKVGKGSVFYVTTLLSGHQHQIESVKFDMKLNITGFGQ